jgi:hypothetical protein
MLIPKRLIFWNMKAHSKGLIEVLKNVIFKRTKKVEDCLRTVQEEPDRE